MKRKSNTMKDSTFKKYCLVVDEWFINGFNGTKAYQKFYPEADNDSSAVRFNELVRISKIELYISKKKESAAERLKTSHEALLQELENWAYSDITETLLLTPEQVKELPIEIRRLITKYKATTKTYTANEVVTSETVIELWFVSKEKAMEMIHKHVGFYEVDNKQKQPFNQNILNIDPLNEYDKTNDSIKED